jgi:hypothetical protein
MGPPNHRAAQAKLYPDSLIKRARSTKTETETRRRRVLCIVENDHPMIVRRVYYQAVVQGLVGKTENDYDKIQNDLTGLRRSAEIPYDWLIDEGRRLRRPYTVEGIVEALNNVRLQYRKDPWQRIAEYVQIWVEKNALAGVIEPVTNEYDVALMAAVGYSSITFAHQAAQIIKHLNHPVFIYHFGDYDPSGVDAARALEKEFRLHAPGADVTFERVAVTHEQLRDWNLPTRPTKASDPRAKKFGSDISVELDAIKPSVLRDLVRGVIERHLPRKILNAIDAESEIEKTRIGRMLDDYIERTRPRTYFDFGSEHLAAINQASRIKMGGGAS